MKRQRTELTAQAQPEFGPVSLAPSLFSELARFIYASWLKIIALSALVLVPCFWHREIAAGDLGSHLYNAWLAELIERGQVSGLKIVSQWNNVLFDFLLAGFGKIAGLHAAEYIAVAIAVLIFFWGAFALTFALAGRVNWAALSCLLMVTYGWTFAAGFFNYYLSLGLSFFALAIFLKGKGWEKFGAIALAPLVYLAHPMGLVWLIGAIAYLLVSEATPWHWQMGIIAAGVGALYLIHVYLQKHFRVESISARSRFFYNGADQLVLFGTSYWIVAAAFAAMVVAVLATEMYQEGPEEGRPRFRTIIGLYVLIEAAVLLMPDSIWLSTYGAPAGYLLARLTSISAILICCLIATARPRAWETAGFAAVAIFFFGLLYADTGRINQMERTIKELVHSAPAQARILGTLHTPRHWRVLRTHLLDRACIGYCFSYDNYEPTTGQFRIRVEHANPYQLMDHEEMLQAETGKYVVKAEDLPVYQLYECGDATQLCLHALRAGELNNEIASSRSEYNQPAKH